MKLKGHYLIVGATCGLGQKIAEDVIVSGGVPLLLARSRDKLSDLAQRLALHENQLQVCNLEDVKDVETIIDRLVDNIATPLNGMVYVAGYHKLGKVGVNYSSALEKSFQVNFFSFFRLVEAFSLRKNHAKNSSIVAISSIAAHRAVPGAVIYAASKGAMSASIPSLAVELSKKGIRVNAISPGWLSGEADVRASDQLGGVAADLLKSKYPLGIGDYSDVSNAAIYLLSDAAKWVTGTDMCVDGGRCCV